MDLGAVAEAWARLEGWFAEHRPDLDLALRPPATESQIAAAEQALDVRFPDDLRASFLIHDGQGDEPGAVILPYGQRLGSLASIVECWRSDRAHFFDDPQRLDWLDDSGRTRQVHLHPRQIPLAGSPYWDYDRLLVDYVPAGDGHPGQIIARSDIFLIYLCDDITTLIACTADGLADGTIILDGADDIGNPPSTVYLTPRSRKPLGAVKYLSRASRARSRPPRSPRG